MADCVPRCLARLTGISVDDVIVKIGDLFNPSVGVSDIRACLNRLGFADDDLLLLSRHALPFDMFKTIAWGRRALMRVINIEGDSHCIYWDGTNVYDPQQRTAFTGWHNLLPEDIILFHEMR